MNSTICGCLRFTDEQYEWDRTHRLVRRHYRSHPECQERARQSWIWQQREPIGNKREIGEEHDPGYDLGP